MPARVSSRLTPIFHGRSPYGARRSRSGRSGTASGPGKKRTDSHLVMRIAGSSRGCQSGGFRGPRCVYRALNVFKRRVALRCRKDKGHTHDCPPVPVGVLEQLHARRGSLPGNRVSANWVDEEEALGGTARLAKSLTKR